MLSDHLLALFGKRDDGVSHCHGVIGRVQAHHLSAVLIDQRFVVAGVIMPKEYQVEARNILCYLLGCIFTVSGCLDATVPSAVKKTYDNVGMLVALKVAYPLAGR